jgi:hypothetical protein
MLIDDYFVNRLNQRFGDVLLDNLNDILSESERIEPIDIHNRFIPYKTLIPKLYNPKYKDSVYYVNKKLNAIFVTISDNLLINVLYLDGKYGY